MSPEDRHARQEVFSGQPRARYVARVVRVVLSTAVVIGVLAVVGAATSAASSLELTCTVGGRTTLTGITLKGVHVRFRWWYGDSSSYLSRVSVWPDSSGRAWIPTHGRATRVVASVHRGGNILGRIRTACD